MSANGQALQSTGKVNSHQAVAKAFLSFSVALYKDINHYKTIQSQQFWNARLCKSKESSFNHKLSCIQKERIVQNQKAKHISLSHAKYSILKLRRASSKCRVSRQGGKCTCRRSWLKWLPKTKFCRDFGKNLACFSAKSFKAKRISVSQKHAVRCSTLWKTVKIHSVRSASTIHQQVFESALLCAPWVGSEQPNKHIIYWIQQSLEARYLV